MKKDEEQMEWINLSEDEAASFTVELKVSFTKGISLEEAKKMIYDSMVYSAENLISNDPANYFAHFKSIRVDK